MAKGAQSWESRIGRRLKLRDLHILGIVVEWGSMAKAAAQLAMSQPAVSESIANLESTLGVRLLDRSARGVEPTLYAEALLTRGRVVFDELMQGVRDIEFLANPAVGEVRVAAGDTSAATLLAPAIDRMSRRHPGIVVRVITASDESRQYPELRDRRVDVVVARLSKSFARSDLHVEHLFDDPARIAAGLQSPWARRRKIALADLAGETWTVTSDEVIRGLIADAFLARGLDPPREKVTASSMLLRSRLLATGRYLTVLPDSVLRCNAKEWGVKALPVDLGSKPMAAAILTLKDRTVSPVVRIFIEQVRAAAGAMRPG